MSYEFKIALRYIFSKRSYNFITVITTISIIGITTGVAALIAVMSIFNGFQDITRNQITGFDPHIRITSKYNIPLNPDSLNNIIDFQEIKVASPMISAKAIAMNKSKIQVFNVMSLPQENESYLDEIKKNMLTGMFDISDDAFDKILIGASLADKLRVLPGDTLTILSPQMIERSLISYRMPTPLSVIVWGIYQMNIKDYDDIYGFINLSAAHRLFRTNELNTYDIRLNNPNDAENFKSKIKSILTDDYNIDTWIDLNKDLYGIMQFERLASFIIMSLIIVIAVFNILASLTMTVVEKQKDIAILKSLGARNISLGKIFFIEGALTGIISTVAGVAIGLLFCYGQIHFKWFAIDGNKYIIDAIPISVNYNDVLITIVFSVLLSLIATIYPAARATRTNITEALKSE